MKHDMEGVSTELKQEKQKNAELEARIQELEKQNEYLSRLVKKYRSMLPDNAYRQLNNYNSLTALQKTPTNMSITVTKESHAPKNLKQSVDLDAYLLGSQDSSRKRNMPSFQHAKSESNLSRFKSGLGSIEHLHMVISQLSK